MKTIINLGIIALTISLLFSCKKTGEDQGPGTQKLAFLASKNVIQSVKEWVNNQPANARTFSFMTSVNDIKHNKLFKWEETEYFPATKIAITPVTISHIKNASGFKYLATKFKDDGTVGVGFYFDVFSKSKNWEVPRKLITPEFLGYQKIPGDFSGAIIMYDMYEGLIMSNHYEKGNLIKGNDMVGIKKGKPLPKDEGPANPNAPTGGDCTSVSIEWYWQTYYNGVLIYEEYLFTTTELICEGTGTVTGGGAGTCQEEFNNAVNGGSAVSNGTAASFFDSSDPTLTRDIPYNWKIYYNLAYGIISYETGTVERITYPNIVRWEYTNMVHVSLKDYGSRVYTCIDPSCVDDCHLANFTFNISPTRMKCDVRVDFKVVHKAICNGTVLGTLDKPFSASRSFYAPNSILVTPSA